MSKLENISALLVATNSAFTKEAAFTTKTTRAELIRMLQATDFAVSEALEVAENYVKVSDQLFEDKEKLSAEVGELNNHYVMQLEHLQEKCSGLETELVTTNQRLTDCNLKNQELESKLRREASAVGRRKFRVSEQQAELVAANKELADIKQYTATLQHQVHKYKQQGFFDRLFGRTPE